LVVGRLVVQEAGEIATCTPTIKPGRANPFPPALPSGLATRK
tara:strand:+ start:545 stop:670 length:126 start_codon:yes stop_codon:yes gene_type:complete